MDQDHGGQPEPEETAPGREALQEPPAAQSSWATRTARCRAAEILDAALERDGDNASAIELVEALAYRAELALRLDDIGGADAALQRARSINLSKGDHEKAAETLASLNDLEAAMGSY